MEEKDLEVGADSTTLNDPTADDGHTEAEDLICLSYKYGLAAFRDIPHYVNKSKYPWQEDEREMRMNEYHDLEPLVPEHLRPERRSKGGSKGRRRGRGRSLPSSAVVPSSPTSAAPGDGEAVDAPQPPHTSHDKTPTSASSSPTSAVASSLPASAAPGKAADVPQPLYTSEDGLLVRLEMYHADDYCRPRELLFKSEADEELLTPPTSLTGSYYFYAASHGLSAPSYAHVFPRFSDMDPPSCCNYIEPTTLDGDLQYIMFFRKLMEFTEFRETRDGVLAKAISIARKAFTKMRYFQIEIAVDDCFNIMETEESMLQRYDLYYYIVHEIVFNKKKCETVIKHIRDGSVRLFYDLIEFADEDRIEDVEDTVDELVKFTRAKMPSKKKIKDGSYKKSICEQIDEKFLVRVHLYTHFLYKKMKIAKRLNLTPKGFCLPKLELPYG